VVEASKNLVNVFVDCDWGKKNTDLSKRYEVNGYPTVIFTDSKGKVIEPLGDRSAEGMLAQIQKLSKSAAPALPDSWDKAVDAAKKADKPILYLFVGTNRDSAALEEALFDESLDQAREAFVLVKSKLTRENADAKRFNVSATEPPILLVLDPNAEKPEAAPLKRIVGKKSAKDLLKELTSIPKPKKV
jgi:thiol:disulfide interchange protein